MSTIEEVLAGLDPPLKHEMQQCGSKVSLLLFDVLLPAMVQRDLSCYQLNDLPQFHAIVLHAVNELRLKGSYVALEVMSDWS